MQPAFGLTIRPCSASCVCPGVGARPFPCPAPCKLPQPAPLRAPRYRAAQAVSFAGQAAFWLLSHMCHLVDVSTACSSSRADKEVAHKAITTLAQRGFMTAVADAARSMAAVMHSEATVLLGADEPVHATAVLAALMGAAATGACQYALTMAQLMCSGAMRAGGPPVSPLPSGVVQTAESIADSQLLAAAATVVLDMPDVLSGPGFPRNAAQSISVDCCNAAIQAAQAVVSTALAWNNLARFGGPEGQRLAAVLLRAMRHVAVRRLQVALLDQLAAHAGMGAELGGGEEGEGQGQQAVQAEGWAGSSGAWWSDREEARRGLLVGQGAERRGWLEDYHCFIVAATQAEWSWTRSSVPAGPPPLLTARLAARAAEALCRLCRGQGLGGEYGPAPEWQFAKAQVWCARD